MKTNDAKKIKEPEKEKSRLKTIVADLTLDVSILKELAPKLLTRVVAAVRYVWHSGSLGSPKDAPVEL
ncbi:MAG: hypothetical protein HKL81_07735 [Acidimicrobiaceae bacterium]|nr:hypothetical protein [Acidimicrobiaceae bacterium]